MGSEGRRWLKYKWVVSSLHHIGRGGGGRGGGGRKGIENEGEEEDEELVAVNEERVGGGKGGKEK